jgi:hypothetical protein
VNVPVTVVRKEAFKAASQSMKSAERSERIFYGKRIKFSHMDRRMLGDDLLKYNFVLDNIFETNKIQYFGITFKNDYCVFQDEKIYQIKKLFTDSKQHVIYCQLRIDLNYYEELRCYKQNPHIRITDKVFCFFNLDAISYEPAIILSLPSGVQAVKFYKKLERP